MHVGFSCAENRCMVYQSSLLSLPTKEKEEKHPGIQDLQFLAGESIQLICTLATKLGFLPTLLTPTLFPTTPRHLSCKNTAQGGSLQLESRVSFLESPVMLWLDCAAGVQAHVASGGVAGDWPGNPGPWLQKALVPYSQPANPCEMKSRLPPQNWQSQNRKLQFFPLKARVYLVSIHCFKPTIHNAEHQNIRITYVKAERSRQKINLKNPQALVFPWMLFSEFEVRCFLKIMLPSALILSCLQKIPS